MGIHKIKDCSKSKKIHHAHYGLILRESVRTRQTFTSNVTELQAYVYGEAGFEILARGYAY
jgi:hypothetical protein